jgi:dTDP-4-dehydrorhamnose 3,5-epimerase
MLRLFVDGSAVGTVACVRGDVRRIEERSDRYDFAGEVRPDAPRDAPTVDDEGNRVDVRLDGVVIERVVTHSDHRGSLTEVIDFERGFWDSPVVYAYSFTIRPGRIKGWGMHRRQADRYFVAAGRVRVVLYDGRTTSPSYQQFAEFFFSEASRGLLLIPPGVWHADQNWGDEDAVVVNFPTRPYDRNDPDKYRIDPHGGEIPFDWALRDT